MTYRLRFHARLMKAKCFNHQLQSLIGVHFGNRALDTHVPGDLYLKPQLNLELPDENRFDWFELTGTYIAEGGEAFMTLGYFAATQSEELRRAEDAWKKPMEADKQEEDKSWLYLPPDEQKKYIKAQKKKARKSKGKEEIPDFSKPESDPVIYPETGYDPDVRFFQVRYYFDDFCLLPDTGRGDCSPATPPEKLEKGGTVLLKNVFFETDEAVLRDESLVQLKALKNLMDIHRSMVIEVRGYTDDRGEEDYNLELSERRAEAVTDWLRTEGVAPDRLSAKGFGEKHPIATNNSEAGRTKNRRVEFLIVDM
jgi:outer membrane protein OmpA-like peptidoglycan-associated protein